MRKVQHFISVVAAAAFVAMIGFATVGVVCGFAFATPALAASAEACPGHPDALGTSRNLTINFDEYQHLGSMQYPQTLPLADHEVVITLDDGPVRMLSDRALEILNAQCVKVTYFLVGEMAHYYPDVVRREYASGNTIGTHSQDHPLRFDRISDQKVQWEIDQGIASVSAALGNPKELAPFFRIPGLGRTKVVDQELAKRRLIVFSADVVADDWFRHIKPAQIIKRAMSRLEARGRGILLLHDIHPATVLALPGLLKELKDHGFHVVHVVPGGSAGVMLADGLTPWSHDDGTPRWPKAAADVPAPAAPIALPAPDTEAFDTGYRPWPATGLAEGDRDGAPMQWPELGGAAVSVAAAELPVPSVQDTGVSPDAVEVVGRTLGLRSSLSETGEAGETNIETKTTVAAASRTPVN